MKAFVSYRSILMTAAVAGVFSAVVGALLLIDGAYRLAKIPTESREFVELRKEFVDEPTNQEIRKEIQALDLALRQEYFREQQFTETGAYLLLAGIMLTLILGKSAATMRRKLPQPKPKEPGPDSDERLSRSGRWAVAALLLALVGAAWAMNATYHSELPVTFKELAALREKSDSEKSDSAQEGGARAKVEQTQPKIPDLPTVEERLASWPSFRGPHGSGVSAYANAPTEWDGAAGEGILWKTPLPTPGVNSPIVWRDRVFLSGGTEDVRAVYCFDASSGNILWQREVAPAPGAGDQKIKTTDDTGFAAPSMATDGRLAYAMFADGLVAAFDYSGNQMWRRSLGAPQKNSYGHASSLATHEGSLIVQFDHGSSEDDLSKLLSLDGLTGETNWEKVRKMPASWSSPVVVEHDGQPQIITCGDPWVIAYSPQDGQELWRADCLSRAEIGPSPVYSDGIVFAGNDNAVMAAIRAGGSGDVTDTHLQWTVDYGLPDTCSPLVTAEFVLMLTSYGTLTSIDKKQGGDDPLWEEDFDDDFISSPSLVGDQVYLFGKSGKVWIVEPTREQCKRIAESQLGEECVTSPAFQDGRIYIRGIEYLFCIGKATTTTKEKE